MREIKKSKITAYAMNQTAKIVLSVVVVVLAIWGIYAVIQTPGSPATTGPAEPIAIGFIGPLTGDASSIGTVNRVAVEVAAEEVNAEGGINGRPLKVVYEDGQCNAKAATNAANKLINVDKVPVIIGGLCSTETAAFGPAAMQSKVIVFSYGSSAPSLSKLGMYFFRSYPSDAFQGKFGAEYAYNILKARKVAILYHISEWGTGIKDVFKARFTELGGTVLAEEGLPQEARDYRTALSKIKALNADLIYSPTYPDGGIVELKQAQELGIKTRFFGADAWGDPKLQAEVSGKGDFMFTEPDTPLSDVFKSKILARSGGDQVPLGTAQAYDNLKIVAQVMRQVGTDTDGLQAAIRSIQYSGVSGPISFDQNGDVTVANYVVKRITGGAAVEVE